MTALPQMNSQLARRLERAEAAANAAFVEARARVDPAVGAEWVDVAGAYAMFDGIESPLTQTFGLGLFEPFLTPEFETVERFFRARGTPTRHEVCALAAEASRQLLLDRGYAAIEHSTVLIRSTGRAPSEQPTVVAVREARPDELDLWARTVAQGWASEAEGLAEFLEQLGRVTGQARGVHCFLAEIDGEPIAAATLNLQRDVALLAGASTIPSARRQGAQQALLQARLAFAVARSVDLAMVVTEPGSVSQRNAQRRGFVPVYGRTKWELQ